MTTTPVFGITGWKNSGKTQLVTRLVAEFTARGLKVSTVKHAHHNFDIDKPGADSYRHREAGAVEVALVSGRRWALMHELRDEEEPPLSAILPRLAPCDLILIEGYKRENHPKIEARRTESADKGPLAPEDSNILAIAADHIVSDTALPVYDLNDVSGLADFITAHLDLKRQEP
ncbi:molybdopterin-guanine dinucleotide biosynthesis protein B [Labrenzia sp. PHM005]|uniref:molybdopterin-guanine dinucleotide biosynthesis protein B n=1 Tax=Labrenzia sp. PHM005 TaxID=2590016 RepID=UPI00114067BD|nr:molybdopterin-guanine dinucleotide biosynthesis protein B [Labrenzia sp. PHM005]QDG77905.1 molybdopterin-guanine dinucleotide biosynthesis protein B [Labrenzia sp. PHM005]